MLPVGDYLGGASGSIEAVSKDLEGERARGRVAGAGWSLEWSSVHSVWLSAVLCSVAQI